MSRSNIFERSAARKGIAGLSRLAQVQVLPAEHPPPRLPSTADMATEKTSVLKFETTITYDMRQSGQSSTAAADTYVMLLRTPSCPLWISRNTATAPVGSAYYSYTFTGTQPSAPSSIGENYPLDQLLTPDTVGTLVVSGTMMTKYPIGYDGTHNVWFYVPANMKACVTLTGSGSFGVGAYQLSYLYTQNFSSDVLYRSNATLGVDTSKLEASFPLGNVQGRGGWWRPLNLNCTASGSNVSFTKLDIGFVSNGDFDTPTAAAGSVWRWFDCVYGSPTELDKVSAPYKDTRVTANALLIKNTTAVIEKQGSVSGLRFRPAILLSDVFFTNFTSIYSETATSNKYEGLLEKGAYTYSKPDANSLQFRDWAGPAAVEPLNGNNAVFHLDACNYATVARLSAASTGTDSNTTHLTFVLDTMIEWRNTSTLWPTATSPYRIEEWHTANTMVANMPPWFENFSHLKMAAAAAMRLAKIAYPIVKPYAQQAGTALLKKAIKAIGAPPPQQKRKQKQNKSKPKGGRSHNKK